MRRYIPSQIVSLSACSGLISIPYMVYLGFSSCRAVKNGDLREDDIKVKVK
jgi:hypothetical protein